jgi:putative ABC transport system substrate-binding protein
MSLVRRRQFLVIAGAVLAAPQLGIAQTEIRPPVVGLLGPAAPDPFWPKGFATLLRKYGLVEGRDFVLDARFSGGDDTRLPKLAAELIASGARVIVAVGPYAIDAAHRATQTHPIVMLLGTLPVELGFIKSFAKPGGNVTGMAWTPPEIAGKHFQLISESVPGAKRIAILVDLKYPGMRIYRSYSDRAAATYGIASKHFEVSRPGELSPALERIATYRPDAFFVVPTGEIGKRAKDVVAFAREHKLVTLGTSTTWAASGGVLQYAPEMAEYFDRGASYVHRLMRGENPADLPVEQPRTYRLVVNAKAARAIGYTIPQSILVRADQVIE